MKADQERVRILLSDTITLLCRNGLHFSKHLRLEGVLGITVDDTDVFIVHINELLSEQLAPPPLRVGLEDLGPYLTSSVIPIQQIGAGSVTSAENASAGKLKRDDIDGKTGASKRHRTTEPLVPVAHHHHHHNPNIVTGSANLPMPSQFVRCPGAVIPSDCRENVYVPVASNNTHESKLAVATQRGSKDERSNVRHMDSVQHGAMVPTSGTILLDQWHFNVPKRPTERPVSVSTVEPSQACYIQYGSELAEGGNEKKASIFPQLSVLPMQFAAGVAMAAVDYNTNSQAPVAASNRGVDCPPNHPNNTVENKLWSDSSNQIQQQNSTNERLVFDPLAGCSSWTVSQLMTSQGIMGTDDQQHQSHESPSQNMNQLTFNQDTNNCSDILSQQRGSKESRRSWTSKHKPHACLHPGCRKSYFFIHDLRRHLRQKHNGMDYSETTGRFEAALDDSTSQIGGTDCQQTASPATIHDTDDQSPDSDDEADALMAAAAHVSNLET